VLDGLDVRAAPARADPAVRVSAPAAIASKNGVRLIKGLSVE
jgi:hypothetical protein